MKLIEKAWIINNSNFEQPWFVPEDIYYAETSGKAKTKILNSYDIDDLLDKNGNILTFLTLKLIRAKNGDKYLLSDGSIRTLSTIKYFKEKKERDDKLDSIYIKNPNSKAYIRKGGYYYRNNFCGYTEYQIEAGIYSIIEAIDSVKKTSLESNLSLELINDHEHNLMIKSKIAELENKIIC